MLFVPFKVRVFCACSSMDRVTDYESAGWGFDSLHAHQYTLQSLMFVGFFYAKITEPFYSPHDLKIPTSSTIFHFFLKRTIFPNALFFLNASFCPSAINPFFCCHLYVFNGFKMYIVASFHTELLSTKIIAINVQREKGY